MNNVDNTRSQRRDSFLVVAGAAGIAGPVLFTAGFLVQEAFRRGEYSPVRETVSALEAGPYGWVQQANFVVLGVLTLVFTVGLVRALAPRGVGWVGPLALGVSGVANILAAVFPLREDSSGATYDPGGHVVAGTIFFASSAIGLLMLSVTLRPHPAWRGLAVYTALTGVLAVASFFLMGALVIPEDAPFHEVAGALQRAVVLLLIFPCRVVLGLRLVAVAHAVAGSGAGTNRGAIGPTTSPNAIR